MRTLEHTITTGGTLLAALLAFTALTGAQTSRPTLTTLYKFPGGGDGANPNAGVTGSDGVLYGTTFYGGTANNGTVFSLTPPTTSGGAWTETVLHNFTGGTSDGANPYSGVVIGEGGVLYGTTFYAGTGSCNFLGSGCGIVFSLTPRQLQADPGPRPCSTISPGAPATAPIHMQAW
jgi:uncharacterized repeat protein (TIGR03803 family)